MADRRRCAEHTGRGGRDGVRALAAPRRRTAVSARKKTAPKKKTAPVRKPVARRPAPRPKPPKGPALRAHAGTIFRRLSKEYPAAHCELDFRTPLELVVATILSAQCTDKRVNLVTPALFRRYPNAAALAAARIEDVEEIIRSTGFYHNKAKSIVGMAKVLVAHYGAGPDEGNGPGENRAGADAAV